MRNLIFRNSISIFAGILITILANHPDVNAQYFGENKVRYDEFRFKILKTEHFNIYFYPSEKAAAEQTARMAERWYTRHSKVLQQQLKNRQPLIVYSSHPDFEETNTTQSTLSEGVGGFTEPMKRRIVMPLGASLEETDHVVGHELVHAFQYDLTGQGEGSMEAAQLERLPLWFIEGMAEFLSIGPRDPLTAMWMRDAVRHPKRIPKYKDLNSAEFFPYRYGQALLAYVAGRWGDQAIGDLLKASAKSKKMDEAIRHVLKIAPDTLVMDWQQSLRKTYKPYLSTTDTLYANTQLLINNKKGGGDLNVSPELSPDGKYLVFYSEKSMFAIDLYLADARTGKVIRKLTRIERDPHFESLEFISSVGSWDPSGRRIAISGIVEGHPVLSIILAETGAKQKELSFPNLKEIINPSWSPDGNSIVFSAISNGHSDLFLYDLASDSLKTLTNDLYADLQPAWSPDGKKIIFVTDRYSLNLDLLNNANYGLAIYNIATNSIHKFSLLKGKNQINPQWSSDGQTIYFISDLSGVPNIYYMKTSSPEVHRITNFYSGVSGITSLSPAFSLSRNTDKMVFSTYDDGKYSIYSMNADSAAIAMQNANTEETGTLTGDPAELPPVNRADHELTDLLNNDTLGLASVSTFTIKPYHTKFSLDYIGQPYVFAGGDRYGMQLGGGVAFYWSDMLGNDNLATMVQLQSDQGYTNFAGAVGYLNRKSRWDWGGSVEQIPYINLGYNSGYGEMDSSLVYVEQEERLREMNRDISMFASYPFNRQSRLELSGGYRHIGYDWQVQTRIYNPQTGNQIKKETQHLPVPNSLNLATPSAAFVYDYSLFGATSPILGQRYRFEISPVLGTINYYSILADYRRYVMPLSPITIAGRLLHYGRYGGGSEDNRLLPIFIGYQSFVRGYSAGSFNSDSPVFESLFGSRMAVGNLEVRAPLLGLLHLGKGYYGYLPLEIGMFYDAGVAWYSGQAPSFLGGSRSLVKSYGATARINLMGVVVQASLVKPVDRPQKGWMWQFDFRPGF